MIIRMPDASCISGNAVDWAMVPLAISQTLKKLNGNHGIGGIINALAVTNKTIAVVIHAFLAISAVTILNAVTNAIKSNSSAIEWKMSWPLVVKSSA